MSQQDIVNLAKEGDAKAIAFLISQALQSFGVTAKASRENNTLHLLLEGEKLPAQDACIRVAVKGLQRLQPNHIYFLTIYGRRNGEELPAWTQNVELTKPLNSPPAVTGAARITAVLQKVEPHQNVKIDAPKISEKTAQKPPVLTTEKPKNPQITEQTAPKPSVLTTEKPKNPPQQQKLVGSKTKHQKPWLYMAGLSLILVPISGIVLATQLYKSPSTAATETEMPQAEVPEVRSINSPSPNPQAIPTPKTPPVPAKKTVTAPATVSIKAVGDIIPGTNFPYNKLPQKKEILFESVKPHLKGADILFGNFESTMTDHPYSSKGGGGGMLFAFRTPPSYAKILKDAGFNILNIANNHSYDFNEQGFKDTIKNIDSQGMKAVGKRDQIVYKNVKGVNFAFIGFSNYGEVHNSLLELKAGAEVVKKAKQKADIVVISVHAGAEGTGALNVRNKNEFFAGENRGNMVLFSRTMIDAGADLILGHGPHVARAMELYKGKLIAYSLGNFMGYRTLSTVGELGKSLILDVKMNPQGDFVSGKIIPIALNGQGIPSLDDDFRSVKLIRRLTKSDFPNAGLSIGDGGQIVKQSN
ncbi:CapA family protein [Microcoleus anatoxicus]|uniref:CapA family protein n=1 Tax=Microcoleus anatoxicus TaxID=2705319 RepID=UPI00297AC569|nr:MAG: CapA family protein [Oscillatoriales cyanobacterium]